ncbi:MAG: flagellar brake protein [Sulfuritalea sp.]|nr:flagellar brake protein [Sulfuritalea sp.]
MTDTPVPAEPLPVSAGSEYDKYMLRSAAEMRMVLRGLLGRHAQITVFFNDGQDMLLSMLVEVADRHLVFDTGADEEINRRATTAERHYCVALLDKVRIQFLLGAFARIDHAGRPAFLSALPQEVLRLQRREFYRLAAPIARPLKCRMPLPLPDGGTLSHEATVFDISGGGIGIALPPAGIPFAPGQEIPDCRIELPEVGIVTCTLRVCNVHELALRGGLRAQRAGCEFVRLPGPMATLVQRYIIKVERERKAREAGLN